MGENKKVWVPGTPIKKESSNEDMYIPDNISRDYLSELFEHFIEDHLYDTKQFIKHFQNKRACISIPFPSLLDVVKNSVCYDAANNFDLRILMTLISPLDKKLFKDLATQVSERFVNNPNTPKSPLTLLQFKILLAYRMSQLGF